MYKFINKHNKYNIYLMAIILQTMTIPPHPPPKCEGQAEAFKIWFYMWIWNISCVCCLQEKTTNKHYFFFIKSLPWWAFKNMITKSEGKHASHWLMQAAPKWEQSLWNIIPSIVTLLMLLLTCFSASFSTKCCPLPHCIHNTRGGWIDRNALSYNTGTRNWLVEVITWLTTIGWQF